MYYKAMGFFLWVFFVSFWGLCVCLMCCIGFFEGFVLGFFNSSLLCAIFVFCLFSPLLILLCGMLNANERKLFGMSSSHFSLVYLE